MVVRVVIFSVGDVVEEKLFVGSGTFKNELSIYNIEISCSSNFVCRPAELEGLMEGE